MTLWQLGGVKIFTSKRSDAKGIQAEVRQLRATGRRIAANRKLSLRVLAATGMYTLKGELKPQFR
jgi:hypothetical protein